MDQDVIETNEKIEREFQPSRMVITLKKILRKCHILKLQRYPVVDKSKRQRMTTIIKRKKEKKMDILRNIEYKL